ncbi:multicopper oxidase domain-containing protein [Aerosakkonema funiforme]|uniref:multicopper oxidase domain-containing protein n=1 Tax=Aerosakkonema funiforme TaxID=1246630 RepID=UPI0035B6D32C
MTSQALKDAYIIGSQNFQNWSPGYDTSGYLKVLPHPDQKVVYKDPFKDWQEGRAGNYYSSWGPEKELNITLRLEDLAQVKIDGFGTVKSGDGIIPWLNNEKTPYDRFRGYNGTIPGPMIITEPGDTLNIRLENYLEDSALGKEITTNLHTHGLHVSPVGYGDNVLIGVNPGESWPVSIKIPDNHFIGLDWYHPHLHGNTNEKVASGLGGNLLIAPPADLPDLAKWNPKERPMYFMALQTFGIQQVDRVGSANDPLNQDPTKVVPAGTPLEVLGNENGENIYERSDASFMGYNAKPAEGNYDPKQPTGGAPPLFPYGGGPLGEPVENIIHTVNGQYNPTLDIQTGAWNLFTFANMDSNAFHVIQLVRDDGQNLIPQPMILVAIDGDSSGVVADNRRELTELPILSSGQRLSIQTWFEQPGKYYFLSNATEEIMGDNAPSLTKDKGFQDGHLIWGSQVLATVEVGGNPTPRGAFPEIYDTLEEQAQEIDERVAAARNGEFDRPRTFTWSANAGGALDYLISQGKIPPVLKDTEVDTFEGTYGINGEFFATTFANSQVPLAMPMVGATEVWTIENISGLSDSYLKEKGLDLPLREWHPFHIHQNDFTVLEINGIPVSEIKNAYLDGVLSDTVLIPPTYDPNTPPTPENPYGTPAFNGEPSEVKVLMKFEDFPGTYVNHCHILFHEDAGMMAPVRVVLNTKDTWLGLAADGNSTGQVKLHRANDPLQSIDLMPYGDTFKGGVELAIGDVNFKQETGNEYVTDNITDVITVQSSLVGGETKFTVKVFDGKKLIEQQEKGIQKFNGDDSELLLGKLTPFQNVAIGANTKTSLAIGDIDGDGHADIIVGAAGDGNPVIEVYSGLDYHLMTRINPFSAETKFGGTINLAVGDVDGNNFDDIIVGQGQGGRGLVEIYSGLAINQMGNLDGQQTAAETKLLSETFQPYGDYNGEIKVTSGYVLQRPDVPNEENVQTYHANITTMAVGNVPQGHEAIKIFTLVGGEGHGEESGGMQAAQGHQSAEGGETQAAEGEEMGIPAVLRMDKEFTPDGNIQEISGTFADIAGLSRGEPVIFALGASGQPELIRLQEKNIAQSLNSSSNFRLETTGDDVIYGDTGFNNLMGDRGNDSVYGLSSDDEINGNQGKDMLFGGRGDDLVRGGKDNDEINGNQEKDVCYGDLGDDMVHGGKDNDQVFGNEGQDVLYGDVGDDLVRGGKGNDLIFGNEGQDTCYGDLGNDTVRGGKGNDWVYGNDGQDVLYGDLGDDTVRGGKGNDWVYGNDGQDVLYGDLGDDSLYGGKQNDTVIGGAGDDLLSGDLGNDLLIGENGKDRFVLAVGTGTDTIQDFKKGEDLMVLTKGLTFEQLSITQGTGAALIGITGSNEVLASLTGIQASAIASTDFVLG